MIPALRRSLWVFSLFFASYTYAQGSDADKLEEQRNAKINVAKTKSLQTLQSAANPNQPALLRSADALSFDDLMVRWKRLVVQAANEQYSTFANIDQLAEVSRGIGCEEIIGILPTGVAPDQTHRQRLNGATLFARCSGNDYVTMTSFSKVETEKMKFITIPEAFDSKIGSQPGRRLYFKSPAGIEKMSLSLVKDDAIISIEYWSKEKKSMRAMANNESTNHIESFLNKYFQ